MKRGHAKSSLLVVGVAVVVSNVWPPQHMVHLSDPCAEALDIVDTARPALPPRDSASQRSCTRAAGYGGHGDLLDDVSCVRRGAYTETVEPSPMVELESLAV